MIENYQYNNCSTWIIQAKGLTKIPNSCAVAGNGLMYDNCEGGSMLWINANSYCSSKGMRLPSTSEAIAWNAFGVPSCNAWTWTNIYKNGTYVWNGTSISFSDNNSTKTLFRCVK